MSHFFAALRTKAGTFQLQFTKIENFRTAKYFVTALEGEVTVASFDMKRNPDGSWKVVEPAPSYITDSEAELSSLVEERGTRYESNRLR